jgi:hypothetical protein
MSIISIPPRLLLVASLVACGSAPAAGGKAPATAAPETPKSSTRTARETPLDPKQALGAPTAS